MVRYINKSAKTMVRRENSDEICLKSDYKNDRLRKRIYELRKC